MNDLGKIAVVAGIMGALLLFGIFMQTTAPVAETPAPVTVAEPATEVTVLAPQSLELLDPVYSEKAIYSDGTIRIAFHAAFDENGAESRLPFWIHNVSGDVINILWDRCSMQLPGGNTVNVVNENGLNYAAPTGYTISVAPAGDLFDAVIPVTEITWADGTASLTTGILDQGTFTLVLAIEKAAAADCAVAQRVMMQAEPGCAPEAALPGARVMAMQAPTSEGREIIYYTFRFVLR